MKKTYQLIDETMNLERIIESIKNDVRKYIKREKRKKLSEDENIWMFDCKSSINNEEIKEINFTDITKVIEEAGQNNAKTLYMELISKEVKREKKVIEEEIIEEEIVEENKTSIE